MLAPRTRHWPMTEAEITSYGVLDLLGEAVLILTPAGRIAWANTAAVDLFQLPQPVEGDFNDFLIEAASGTNIQALLSAVDDSPDPPGVTTLSLRLPNAMPLVVEVMMRHCPEWCGANQYLVSMHDVTANKAREAELNLSAKVFEFSHEAIMITDDQDRILSVNDAFTEITGYGADEVIGRQPVFLDAGRADETFYKRLWDTVHREGYWKGEVWNRRKSGEIYPEWLVISAVRNAQGAVDHYISIFSDITERKAREEYIRHQAEHDFLTGLPNRVLLADRFDRLAAGARRHPQRIALLFIDLDGFKDINDRYGHRAGDTLLTAIAERLQGAVRTTDTVSRLGGDEFICLLTAIGSIQAARKAAEAILREIEQPVSVANELLQITASIGMAFYPDHGASLNELMTRADASMYEVKRSGRNGVILFRDDAKKGA